MEGDGDGGDLPRVLKPAWGYPVGAEALEAAPPQSFSGGDVQPGLPVQQLVPAARQMLTSASQGRPRRSPASLSGL